jgi:hypothetical protein
MLNCFYVYIHIRPDNNKPFYVGKGKGGRHKTKTGRNKYWWNVVNKNNGLFIPKILFNGLTEEEALLKETEVEKQLINDGNILVNLAETGKKGPSGVKMTDKHKKVLSKAVKNRTSPNKGKKHGPFPEESKYWKNKKRPKETKQKQTQSQLERYINNPDLKSNITKKLSKMVIQINPKDWSIVNQYFSSKEAEEKTKIKGINQVINGSQNTAGGFIWLGEVKDRPYFEKKVKDDEVIRLFIDLNEEEKLWHKDGEDRIVEILECGSGWKFQYDNALPWDLEPKMSLIIQRHDYHRVIKGEGNLLIKIHKIKD